MKINIKTQQLWFERIQWIISINIFLLYFIGNAFISKSWIDLLRLLMFMYIAIYLTVRYRPNQHHFSFHEEDRQILFYSGFFLLSLLWIDLSVSIIQKIKK